MKRRNALGKAIINRFGPEQKVVPIWESPTRRRLLDFLDSCALLTRPAAACSVAISIGGLITAMLAKSSF
ncbi:MAG: hypothetical protein ACI8UO_004143 [Verrucomicrobiales bacterium]|jgi:hypothetical protein